MVDIINISDNEINIADILCNRIKLYIYAEIIDYIEEDPYINYIYFLNFYLTIKKDEKDELIILHKDYDYIAFLYTMFNHGVFELYEPNLIFGEENNEIKEKYEDLIKKFTLTSNDIINTHKKITDKNAINIILKNLRLILKSIFLTNYIDINNTYAMTCLNIYLYETYNNKKSRFYAMVILIARLLLQTNTFYLNNYTTYLRMSYNDIIPKFTFDDLKIKDIINNQELNKKLNKCFLTLFNDFNNVKINSEILKESLKTIISSIYDIDINKCNTKIDNISITLQENIILNNYISVLIIIFKDIKNYSKSLNKLEKYIKIILFIFFVLLYKLPLFEKNFEDKTFTNNYLKFFQLPTNENKDKIKSNIIELYDKIYLMKDEKSINIIEIIEIIFPDVVKTEKNGGGYIEADNNTNIKIFNYIIKKIDIDTFNKFSNIFKKYNDKIKCNQEKISYKENTNNIDFINLLLGGGNNELIIGGNINDIKDTLQLNYSNPIYLLNYIPMNNCKRHELLNYIKKNYNK